MKLKSIFAMTVFMLSSAPALSQQWAWEGNMQTNNGAVSVKTLSGASGSIAQNPTGIAAMASMAATTQPPTVLKATANLPIVNEGDACEATPTDGDTAAVNPDRTLILSCQSDGNGGFVWRSL